MGPASASGGANSLWLTEWLAAALNLKEGMRVLDLAADAAASSIFLQREFGVQVWATDLWIQSLGEPSKDSRCRSRAWRLSNPCRCPGAAIRL